MWRSWYLYIYAFRFLENGYMNPTSIGATWVSNFWRPTTPSPNSLTPRIVVKGAIFLSKFRFFKKACDLWSSDKPKVDLRTKSPRFKHGNHFFYRTTFFFTQRIPRLCVVFWALFIDPSDLARKKTQNLPQTTTDLMLKRIWSLAKIHLW